MSTEDWEKNGPDHAERTGDVLRPGKFDATSPAGDEQTAFISAIIMLANDEGFRRSFLEHYQLWLHPPILVARGATDLSAFDFRAGAITFVDDVDPASRERPSGKGRYKAANGKVVWCPDTNDMPIEGAEISPRPVMQFGVH